MSDTVVVQGRKVVAALTDISPRANLDMLLAAIDVERGSTMTAWLFTSLVFGET